ncbi:MAG TPA: NADH-quinone oxidoreductase subunit NuoK [Aquifex aeolicus]|uniref:NADH-quinone oxidoreductase subunit K n=1 Tax=Aquifex aeolicus TaxID=63363 RepID=A0A9D1CEW9_AQUAO|nr:NADH-quinone oxidoreductase subunit NuoK [Aquificales bacterium]HIP86555.1 NADH-quinone oxidoreductase subunit NuoK [Aquifex sp.]HIP98004.1 NADH-quinone oxidoreductase subunit NuoK [Aquifex aeolicus]HIQ26849.1 NADH-quinone oxidoreductase subunit NuoK [Aquifex aeolicus]
MQFTQEPMLWFLLVAVSLLAIGVYGLLSRKSILKMIISIEIIVNGANVGLAAFATQHGADGVILAFFAIALAALEVAVGLTLLIILARKYSITFPEKINNLRW